MKAAAFARAHPELANQNLRWEDLEAELCRRNPIYWIENHCHIFSGKPTDAATHYYQARGEPIPDPTDLDFKLWPQQVALAEALLAGYAGSRDRWVLKAREIGATWIACALIRWAWWSIPGFTALLISAREDKVDDGTHESLFGKIRYIDERLPGYLRVSQVRDTNMHLVNLDTGAILKGSSTSLKVGRSERYDVVACDEWAHVERRLQRPIMLAFRTVARSKWRISTPSGKGDEFHLSYIEADEKDRIVIGYDADPLATPEYYESLLVENKGELSWDERAQEHGCSFAGVSGQRVWKAASVDITYTDADLPDTARRDWMLVAGMDFGTGPSWTVCLWALVNWDESPHPTLPLVRLDSCRVWERTAAHVIGAEILEVHKERGYGHNCAYVGDPSGIAADPGQSSWEQRLRAAGVPLFCLPAIYNSHDLLYVQSITEVQTLMDAGLLTFHERFAAVVIEAIETWEWDIPSGVNPMFVNKADFKPRKDWPSHPCNALQYLVAWVLRLDRQAQQHATEIAAALPPSSGAVIADVYSKAARL